MASPGRLDVFERQKTILLTTYRKDGTPVGTPVHIALDGGRAFFRTWDTAWKARRIRNNPDVEIAPSTASGKPTGPSMAARARLLDGSESVLAARALARKYPMVHGWIVPLIHRLRGNKTVHFELTLR